MGELCVFSGYKIYPGHGRSLVKVDGKNLRFLSGRTHKAHLLKRNPREVTWTVLYRRKHKKGQEEDVSKKRNKRTQKFQRAVVGATLADIMAKRNQKPKLRESRLSELLRNRRNRLPPRRLQTLLTRKPRRPRQSRMFRNLLLESEERDKCDIIGYKHRCKLICLQ